jgi:transposase-like protein
MDARTFVDSVIANRPDCPDCEGKLEAKAPRRNAPRNAVQLFGCPNCDRTYFVEQNGEVSVAQGPQPPAKPEAQDRAHLLDMIAYHEETIARMAVSLQTYEEGIDAIVGRARERHTDHETPIMRQLEALRDEIERTAASRA